MKKPGGYFIRIGMFFMLGGSVSSVAGGTAMFRFLKHSPALKDFTVGELARGLIVPHVFMLLGTGVMIYGGILVIRGMMLNTRLRQEMETP